jgi:hypothetical protein
MAQMTPISDVGAIPIPAPLRRSAKLIRRKPLKHESFHDALRRGSFLPPARQRIPSVTVCIAARSGALVMGASDRMLTSGDIQFEPPLTSKLTLLTSSLGILQAGDAAFHSEIMWGVVAEVEARIKAHPTEWWFASEVADLYAKHRNIAKRKRAEATLLAPLGLNLATFRQHQQDLKDDIADQITRDLINYAVPNVQVLVVGIDTRGPHIYVIDNGDISCNDVIGFAAIGIGARHAESQFMIGKHAWRSSEADTALLSYVAKKRSEVAPGVGEGTDMFTAGPRLGSLEVIADDVVQRLDRIYRRMIRREDRSQRDARKEVNDYVNDRQAQRAAAQQQAQVRQKPDGEAEVTAVGGEPGTGTEGKK